MPQSLSSVLVHLVFSTKNREPWIKPEIESELHAYLATIFNANQSPAILIGGDVDHIHALFVLARTQTIASVVEQVKKSSSKWIKTKGKDYAQFQWQAGYGAFSIGQSSVDAVKKYIATQKEHHRHKTTQDEFREFLEKYKVEYDERYVWD